MITKQMGERTFNKHIYRVVFWNNSGEIKVTAPTTYEDAYKTAESYKGVIYKMMSEQPIEDKI